jgi:hypothetical protein
MPPKIDVKQASFEQLKDVNIKSQKQMADAIARLAELEPPKDELLRLLKKYMGMQGMGGIPLISIKSKPLKKEDLSKVVRLATGKEPSKRAQGFTKAQAIKELVEAPAPAAEPAAEPAGAAADPAGAAASTAAAAAAAATDPVGALNTFQRVVDEALMENPNLTKEMKWKSIIPFAILSKFRKSNVDTRSAVKRVSGYMMGKVTRMVLGDYTWCGPGTDIMKNIMEGRMPKNELDEACANHDLAFLEASTEPDADKRSAIVRQADQTLVAKAREIHDSIMGLNPERGSALFREAADADKVAKFIGAGSWTGATELFAAFNPNEMTPEDRATVDGKLIKLGEEIVEDAKSIDAGFGFSFASELDNLKQELPLPRKETEGAGAAAPVPEAAGARTGTQPEEEEKREEEPAKDVPEGAAGEPLQGGEQVAEVTPVLPEGAAAAVAPPRPQIRVDPDEFKEHQKMTPVPSGAIVGERSMRPMAFRMEGDTTEPSKEQVRQNMLWLDNFTWIDEGNGLGNQQRVPWEMGGGAAHNSSFEAQKLNKMMKYSGDLRVGNQHVREVREVTPMTRAKFKTPMYSTTQNRQRMIRNGALSAGLGRTIQMYRDSRDVTPMMYRNAPMFRLENGDVVDGRRV